MTDDEVLEQGVERLRRLLGEEWSVQTRPEHASEVDDSGGDAMLEIKSGDGVYVSMLVEVASRLTPKNVVSVLAGKAALMRRINSFTRLLVMAPWISPITRETLRDAGIDYLDLTGNVSLRVSRPAIIIDTRGADRAPADQRVPSKKPRLTGAAAGRLVRLLVDVAPPYRATQLARYAGLSVAYVSRLLDALDDLLLIRREGKVIVSVDWPRLLRARADVQGDLLRQTNSAVMLAPNGVAAVMKHLRSLEPQMYRRELLVTGSYAARAFAPIAIGGQLMLYVQQAPENAMQAAEALGLLPVPEGGDVLLLHAQDPSVWQRPLWVEDHWQVGLSQLVLDCLTGPGRMPAEGEALLEVMASDQSWRSPDFYGNSSR